MQKKKTSEAHLRAVSRYEKANVIQYNLKLNKKTDGDIIKRLKELDNKQGYIKELIRLDLYNDIRSLNPEADR